MPQNERILIVDDFEDNLKLLERILSKNGYRTICADNGPDAIRLTHGLSPDIVLLDLELPGMDGFEICRQLKSNPATAAVPIIFVSAHEDTESIVRAFSLGGSDYVNRPFQPPEILARIELHLSLRKMRSGLEREIDEHRITEDRLRQSEAKFRHLVENAPVGILTIDPAGTVRELNPTVLEILGSPSAEATRAINTLTFPPLVSAGIAQDLQKCLDTGESAVTERSYTSAWGKELYLRMHFTPIESNGGRVTGVQVIAEDISDTHEARLVIEAANDALSARVHELGTLNTIMQTVAAGEELDTVLGIVAETMTHFLNAGACLVGLFNESHTSLKILKNFIPGRRELPLHVFDFPVAEFRSAQLILETEQPLIIEDAWTNPLSRTAAKLMKRFDLQNFLVIPLKVRGRTIGVLILGKKPSSRSFPDEEIRLAETIAGQLAGAMENTRLLDLEKRTNRRLRQANRQIVRDLKLAREIQYGLLPSPRPDWSCLDAVCYTVPARSVGGDFYQYHDFSGDRFGLAVGDISGKGTAAALLMATCLSRLDACFSLDMSPAERLGYLDREIARYTRPRGQFCALCYAEIFPASDAGRRRMEIVTAGAFGPIVKRANGAIETPHPGGLPLGTGFGTGVPYRSKELELYRGDILILASDGLVETMNAKDQMLGFDRLEAIVAGGPSTDAVAMLEHLKAETRTFARDVEQHDDLTIIVTRV